MAPRTRSKQASPDSSAVATTFEIESADDNEIKFRARSLSRVRGEEVVIARDAINLANKQQENVFLFVPNIIGYIRVITAAVSLYIMPVHPKVCTVVYFVSSILDVFDGMAARYLNQTSKFGAVLDMVTDRCATACLLCFLQKPYPEWRLLFMFLISLDFSSHYIHMYSTLVTGSTSHKAITSDVSRILSLYYTDRNVLFLFCFANEVFFVCAYLNAYEKTPIHSSVVIQQLGRLIPFHAIAQALPGILSDSFSLLFSFSWAQAVGAITFPICVGKQIINVVQFWKASKILVGVDLAERQAEREKALQ